MCQSESPSHLPAQSMTLLAELQPDASDELDELGEFLLLMADSILAVTADADSLGISQAAALDMASGFAAEAIAGLSKVPGTSLLVNTLGMPNTLDELQFVAMQLIDFVQRR